MERIIKFYEYCDIQPPASKTYPPLLNPTGINVRINTNIIERIYGKDIRIVKKTDIKRKSKIR